MARPGIAHSAGERRMTTPRSRVNHRAFARYELALAVAGALAACSPAGVSSTRHATQASEPRAPVPPTDGEQVEKLVAFATLLGDVRYFHPSDEGATADWEALAIAAVPLVERARSADELASALSAVFAPVAPTLRVYTIGEAPAPPAELAPPLGNAEPTFVGWVHRGVSLDTPQPLYASKRIASGTSSHVAPGDLTLGLPVSSVRGKKVRVRASGRAEVAPASAGASLVLLMVSHEGYQVLASAPIGGAGWRDLEITANVPDLRRIGAVRVGLRLFGDGRAWIDDVSVSVDGGATLRLEDADFESATTGEVPAGWQGDGADGQDYRTSATGLHSHGGARCGQIESRPLASELLPLPEKTLHVELGAGVRADLPVSLYVNPQGRTLPAVTSRREPPASMRERQFRDSANDRSVRLADVALAWNVFEHFYPYFDVVPVDWPAELRAALRRALHDGNAQEFQGTLARLVAALHDGHGHVSRVVPGPKGKEGTLPGAVLPLAWRIVQGQLIVTDVPASGGDIQRGDIVVSIDRVPALRSVAEMGVVLSAATPQSLAWRAPRELLFGPFEEEVELSLQRGAAPPFETRRQYGATPMAPRRTIPEKVVELAPGVVYVDVDRITDEDFAAALPKLVSAHGVLFDLRGYPSHVSSLPLRHLTDQPLRGPYQLVPKATRPHRDGIVFENREHETLAPLAPRIRGRIVFLADGRTVSEAETWMGIVEAYRLGDIVGEATAGTNGNINSFILPGGYRVTFTGLKTLKQDGTRHHGVGIAPTIPCAPTIAGVTQGRDEVLECGLAAAMAR
jgi:hypothetical protein